jgi:hypothetical protein
MTQNVYFCSASRSRNPVASVDLPLPDVPIEEPWDELAQAGLQIRCEHCHVAPGTWCRTKSGNGSAHLHASRMLVVQGVFWLGYQHGFAHGEQRAIEASDG